MKRTDEGHFSRTLKNIEAELSLLMEEVGGKDACELLDALSCLPPHHRTAAIRLFNVALQRVILTTPSSRQAVKNVSDESIKEQILAGIRSVSSNQLASRRRERLHVVDGGRSGKGQLLDRIG